MLYKLVKFVHINIREKLRSKVADRYSFARTRVHSLSLSNWRRIAFNNRFKKPHRVFVLNFLFKNKKKSFVVHAVKKFLDVAFQNKTLVSHIFRYRSHHTLQKINAFVRAKTDSTGKRSLNKCLLKNLINYRKNGVVQNTLSRTNALWMRRCFGSRI